MSTTLETALAFVDRHVAACPPVDGYYGLDARMVVVVKAPVARSVEEIHFQLPTNMEHARPALMRLVEEASDINIRDRGSSLYHHADLTTATGLRFSLCLTDAERQIVEAAVIARAFASAGAA